jgi:hypothetical protein
LDHFGAKCGHAVEELIFNSVHFGSAELFFRSVRCICERWTIAAKDSQVALGTNNENMTYITRNLIPKLHKAPQPPLSHIGAIPDSDRAKRPPLAEPPATGKEPNPGDRVEGLGSFGKPTGEFGTVEQANEDDAVVKWDDDGRMRLHQPSLRKVEP